MPARRRGRPKDQFGVSWQIVSSAWEAMIQHADPQASERATTALLKMKELYIAEERALRGT